MQINIVMGGDFYDLFTKIKLFQNNDFISNINMYELYKMMKNTQGKPLPNKPIGCFANVSKDFQFLIDWFKKVKNKENFFEIHGEEMDTHYFHKDGKSIEITSEAYKIPSAEIIKWITDSRYKKLFEQKMTIIKILPYFEKKIKKICQDIFNLETNLNAVFWSQRPGQMSPLHYDRKKHVCFDIDESELDRIKRYIIFLDDQKEGQIFYMAGHYFSWKAGDVLSWDQIHYQHGSSNFGYEERPTLLVTGLEKKK